MSTTTLNSNRLVISVLFGALALSGCSGSGSSPTPDVNNSSASAGSTNGNANGSTDAADTAGTGGSSGGERDNSGSTTTGTSTGSNNSRQDDNAGADGNNGTSSDTAGDTAIPSSTRVDFDITVPVYVSTSLQVRVAWGQKQLVARWVTDESWAISDEFPVETENPLTITFSDNNGALTLGSYEALFKTGSNESQYLKVNADQFETGKWDDDGDGLSNLQESIDGTDPKALNIVDPAVSSLQLVADKTVRIEWQSTEGAEFYRVLENADGVSGYTQISEDLDASTNNFDHRVALYKRINARYIVQACNTVSCVDSEELSLSGSLVEGIGYFKSSNIDENDNFGESVALNADGSVLAVGTYLEDSSASGVNGNQTDNSAKDTGAVYVFVRRNNMWRQQAYIKASNPDDNDFYGFAISLSADGNTLAVGAANEDSSATGINGDQRSNDSEDSGAVYVYVSVDGIWKQQAYIKASNTNVRDKFGISVKLSGDGNTLVAGATRESSGAVGVNGREADNSAPDAGAVYVFARIDGNWQQEAYIKASNSQAGDSFGGTVGLSADARILSVGASGEASASTGVTGDQRNNRAARAGAVYVFENTNGVWQQQAYLKASNTDSRDSFGIRHSLSANGSTLAIAAYFEGSSATGINGNQNDDSFSNAGAVYVFDNADGTWQQQAYVKSSNTEENDFFGISLTLSGDGNTMVVGAFFA